MFRIDLSPHRRTIECAAAARTESAQKGRSTQGASQQVSRRSSLTFAAVAIIVALTAAPALAGNGNPSPGTPPGQTADPAPGPPDASPAADPVEGNHGNGLGNGGGDGNNGNGGNSANAHANAGQDSPSNANVVAHVDQPGDTGAVDQNNSAGAAADAVAVNDAGPAQASADASAQQAAPSNVNLSARVNSPGDDGPTTQQNSADAAANAGASGASGSQADANATATQDAPVNVNVAVRVNSPGNQGAVTQANTADAAAGTAPKDPAVGPQTAGVVDGNSADVDNSAGLEQSLEQCGTNCTSSPQPAAAPSSEAVATVQAPTETTATASQQSPMNVNVTVRVASPGLNGEVDQSSTATANADQAVSTSTSPTNINVQVEIAEDPGENVEASGNGQPWTWNWDWELGRAPDAASTDTNEWNWDWTNPATTVNDGRPAAPAPVDGHWLWIFTYTAPDGTLVTVTTDQQCACAWVWSWTWSGGPVTTAPPTAAAPPDAAQAPPTQITQTNDASATAVASASLSVQQQTSQETQNSGAVLSADQVVDVVQAADASSFVSQTAAANWSVVTAGEVSTLAQWNLVEASSTAQASFEAGQAISQSLQLTSGDLAEHRQTALQEIVVVQTADAGTRATQTRAHNRNVVASTAHSRAPTGPVSQANTAWVEAVAVSSASVSQRISQQQLGEGADQVAAAAQNATTLQDAQAGAEVAQADLGNTNDVLIPHGGLSNPALDQSNVVHASAQMTNDAAIDQKIVQSENGAFVVWNATAEQHATIIQSGDASASAAQAGIENLAGWRGEIAGAFAGSGSVSDGMSATPVVLEEAPPGRIGTALPPTAGGVVAADATLELVSPPRTPTPATAFRHSSSGAPTLGAPSSGVSITPRAAESRLEAGSCAPFCHTAYGSGLDGGPAAGLSGAWYALQPRAFKPAAPGVGRLLDDAPALGRPVDIAPFERPG